MMLINIFKYKIYLKYFYDLKYLISKPLIRRYTVVIFESQSDINL